MKGRWPKREMANEKLFFSQALGGGGGGARENIKLYFFPTM